MKQIINGQMYNSETATELAEKNHYNNNNYSGTTYLLVTSKGAVFCHTDSNGQDLFLRDAIYVPDNYDGFEAINDEAETKMIELGLIKEA